MSLSRRLANLGKAIDSATTGHFLSKGDSDGLFETIQYTDLTGRPTVLDSANITAIIDSAYIQLRQTSAGSGGLDSAAITTLVDSAYVSARSPAASSGFAAYEYNTSAAQTTFQDSDVNGNVLSYSADGIIVYYNGVLMPTSDYTATDGSSVVFTTAVDSGGTVTIAKWALASSGGSGGSSFNWGGDRAIVAPGFNEYIVNQQGIDYFDITTTGNASDFGDVTAAATYHVSALSDGSTALFAGGNSRTNVIDYVTISTPSNATDFGDLNVSGTSLAGISHTTYGVWGGVDPRGNTIQYVTIASPGNASDFGDLTVSRYACGVGMDATYGLFAGGDDGDAAMSNAIDYITIATTSNASDFGDLLTKRNSPGGASDATRSVFAGGYGGDGSQSRRNEIEYVTTATPSNATDFGDLSTDRHGMGGTSNGTRAVFTGGDNQAAVNGGTYALNTIDYVTIQTTSNSSDFGDLTTNRFRPGSCSGT